MAAPEKIARLERFIGENPAMAEGLKGFIAGVTEGDGNIGISIQHPERTRLGFTLTPKVDISCTSQPLIRRCAEIMAAMGVRPQMNRYNRKTKAGKLVYAVRVRNLKGVLKLLEAIYPYLVSKKKQAKVVMDFCRLRLSKTRKIVRDKKGRIIKNFGDEYTDEEVRLYEKVIELNRKSRRYRRKTEKPSARALLEGGKVVS